MQRTGRLGLGSSGHPHEVVPGGSSWAGPAFARGRGTQLSSRPVLLVEVRAEGGDVSAVMPDTPPVLLPNLLVAEGLELCFDLAIMVHILAELHVLGGSFSLALRVAVLQVPLQPPHEPADDDQARLPTDLLGAGQGLGSGCGLRCRCRNCKDSLMSESSYC